VAGVVYFSARTKCFGVMEWHWAVGN
jgi:hypothetical protein